MMTHEAINFISTRFSSENSIGVLVMGAKEFNSIFPQLIKSQ